MTKTFFTVSDSELSILFANKDYFFTLQSIQMIV